MKKLNILILSALTAVSGSAMAMGFTVEQGKNLSLIHIYPPGYRPPGCHLPECHPLECPLGHRPEYHLGHRLE